MNSQNRFSTRIALIALLVFAAIPCARAAASPDRSWERSLAVCADDFDEDGVPDLVLGYATKSGGGLMFYRGNVDAIHPNTIEARERRASGAFLDDPFLPPVLLIETSEAPEFLVAGDFDNDGHRDVAFAAGSSSILYLAAGTGRGTLGHERPISLPGPTRMLASGEVGHADGLPEILVDVDGARGVESLVFEGSHGALRSRPRVLDSKVSFRAATGDEPFLRMRLNEDGVDDLVRVHPDSRTPIVRLSRPEQTFMVTNVNDSGAGSLRAAIDLANGSAGADTIAFSIAGNGTHSIALQTPLPAISPDGGALTIDATTQPGYQNKPLVELNGTNTPVGTDGLVLIAPNCVVRGLAINGFVANSDSGGGRGIYIIAGGNCKIEANYIGTDVTGQEAVPNTFGVDIQISAGTVVGGTASAARNVLSGNMSAGVIVSYDETASNNLVQGNLIGTNASGATAIPNGTGVYLSSAANNTIGGTSAGARNVISGSVNPGFGVGIAYEAATGNLVQGNYIGVAQDGTAALGNGLTGIIISSGASFNVVGGPATGAANVIAYNREGVQVLRETTFQATSVGNLISRNSIYSNDGLGINLSLDYDTVPAPNDQGDVDDGPNNFQNYPEISSVSGGRIRGQLLSRPSTAYTVEFYRNDECDQPSGFGEGKTFLGSASVVTNAGGFAEIDSTFSIPSGAAITATATDPDNNTSEFSQCFAVGGGGSADLSVTVYSDASAVAAGRTFTYYVGVTNNGPGTASSVAMTDPLPQQVTFLAATPVAGWTITAPNVGSNGSVVATTGLMPVGAQAFFLITVRVRDNAASGDLINTASVTSAMDPSAGNNSGNNIVRLNGADAAADVSVTIKASPDPVQPLGQIIYSINVANAGPQDATDTLLSTSIPEGTTYAFSVPYPTTSPEPGGRGTITWDLGSYASGSSNAFFVVVNLPSVVPSPPVVTNSAEVTNSTRDPNTNNNTAMTTSQVQASTAMADLAVTISANAQSVQASDTITYTIGVANNGPSNAANVVLFDQLPNGVYFIRATSTQGTLVAPSVLNSGAVVLTIGSLASGASATITTVLTVTSGGGTLLNQPFALSSATDPNTSNNAASISTPIRSAGMAMVSWDPPDLDSPEDEPPPRNLQAASASGSSTFVGIGRIAPARSVGARRAGPPTCYNIYTSNIPNVTPNQANFYGSVPPSQTSTMAPVAPGGSFFVVTACYPTGESPPTNEDGAGEADGPSVSSVVVTDKKITVKGAGFAAPMQVFIDGIPFTNSAKVKTAKVNQKGTLLTGQTLAQYARSGQSVAITIRNSAGGTTTVSVSRR